MISEATVSMLPSIRNIDRTKATPSHTRTYIRKKLKLHRMRGNESKPIMDNCAMSNRIKILQMKSIFPHKLVGVYRSPSLDYMM